MRWWQRFLAAAMLLLLLAATAVYLTPLDTYVPEIERALSAGLSEPVKARHLKVGAVPIPHLVLEEVQIGEGAGIALQSVKIIFDIRTLFESQRVIHRVILKNGSATQAQLEKLSALLQSDAATPLPFRVEELQFGGIRYTAPEFSLEPLEGKLEFAPDGSLARAWLALGGKQVTATLHPQPGNTYEVEAQASDWVLPNYPAIQIASLNVSGVLAESRFDAKKFSVEVSGLRMEGGALLEWQPEWRLELRLDALDGKMERLSPLLDSRVVATGDLRGKGSLSARGASVQAWPGNLRIDAEGEISNATVQVPGSFSGALALDSIKAHLSGTPEEYALSGMQARLYGGAMGGSAAVRGSDAVVRADVSFVNIAVEPLVRALSDEVMLTGTLDGRAKFSVKTKEFERFPQNLQLDGEFRVKDGVLRKVDMVQAASNPLKEGNKGGATSFNELSSLLSIDAAGYHFKGLKVSSGALSAEGKLDVSPQKQLSGLLDTDVKGTASLISMPLVVSGTLSEPLLRPTKSALAGASVGTALMGPGLGTALGIKAGNLLDKLFGNKSEKTGEKKEKQPVK